jgi:hypothetical protein
MKLYEINKEIENILEQEELNLEEFEKLNIAFDIKMVNILKYRSTIK